MRIITRVDNKTPPQILAVVTNSLAPSPTRFSGFAFPLARGFNPKFPSSRFSSGYDRSGTLPNLLKQVCFSPRQGFQPLF